jgi:hypothetical protein
LDQAKPLDVKIGENRELTAIMDGFRYRLQLDDTTAMIVVRDEVSDHQQSIYLDRPQMNAIKQLLNLTDL